MQIIVIGAGIVGCAVAHELASRGAHVRVVDPRPVGRGATHASAGMLAPYSEGHHAPLLRLGLDSLALYDGFVERLRGETARTFEYERPGTLQVATGETEAAALARDAATFHQHGVPHQWLDATRLHELEPALGRSASAAILLPTQGYVDALALTRALANAAERRGAHFSSERVLGIHASQDGAAVTTSAGTLQADTVVLAAGSWSSAVSGVASWPPPVRPVRGQMLYVRAGSRMCSHMLWGAGCYVVPWRDGTTLVGATVEDAGFDEQPTAGGVRQLLNAAHGLLPAVGDAAFQEVRVGLRPKTPDELPIIGSSSTMAHVVHATGHYRNGVLLTPLTARLVGDLVLDGRRDPALDLTDPARFGL